MSPCLTCLYRETCAEHCLGYVEDDETREAREAYEIDKGDARRKGDLDE